MQTMRCFMEGCNQKTVLIIGNCKYCKNKFCGQHRLPESHECVHMLNCKQRSFEINKASVLQNAVGTKKVEQL